MGLWPTSATRLVELQEVLGRSSPEPWEPAAAGMAVAGCYVCFAPTTCPGEPGEQAWAAATLLRKGSAMVHSLIEGEAEAAYEPGLLALREGSLLEAAVRALPETPDVLVVNATGRDHPRGAGLAVHLGAVLDIPTVGVTERTLQAEGDWPAVERGAVSALCLEGQLVGFWLRTRRAIRPVPVHAGWRTSPSVTVQVVLQAVRKARTPEPIRRARTVARRARGAATLGRAM